MFLSTNLDPAAIAHALGNHARNFDVDLVDQCESSNSLLLTRAAAGAPSGSVVVARHQTAGRGRRGRAWVSGPGESLTFSLLWRLPAGVPPAGLSLAAGLAVIRAIRRVVTGDSSAHTVATIAGSVPANLPQLKWPNDILLDGRKLGGILVELLPGAAHAAVIGCGLNISLPVAMPAELCRTSAAMNECVQNHDQELDPNNLLAAVLIELLLILEQFAVQGFASLQKEWMMNDAFGNQAVRITSEFAAPVDGICCGVNPDGALRLEVDGEIRVVLSGEVSLRLTP